MCHIKICLRGIINSWHRLCVCISLWCVYVFFFLLNLYRIRCVRPLKSSYFSLSKADTFTQTQNDTDSNSLAVTMMLSNAIKWVLAVIFLFLCASQDILNNLDPRGTGELDDDDLMLDVDLPEDGLHGQHIHMRTHSHTRTHNTSCNCCHPTPDSNLWGYSMAMTHAFILLAGSCPLLLYKQTPLAKPVWS